RSTDMTGTAPDRIELRGLRVRGNHGVFDFEKREGQDFVIDVTLHTSVSRAAATDDLNETIHYGERSEERRVGKKGRARQWHDGIRSRIVTGVQTCALPISGAQT